MRLLFLYITEDIMGENKREVLDMHGGNLAKVNVTRGENLAELYVQNNNITELDLTNNPKLEVLDCTGNPLRYIKAYAPGGGTWPLELEATKGGSVGLKLAPQLQEYYAVTEEGFEFDGWYNELGDRLSREAVWSDGYGASRKIVAWFREK